MDTSSHLQLILPTDKRNPCFSLYRRDSEAQIHVYYGMELLEVVPDDREHVQFKLLVANLYNAGLRVASLEETFEVDRKTMSRWGNGVKSGNAEELVRAFAGRQAPRKLTPAIEAFVRLRFKHLYAENRRNYNVSLRQEIAEVFGVKISGETLRPLLGPLKLLMDNALTPTSLPVCEPEAGKPDLEEPPCELVPMVDLDIPPDGNHSPLSKPWQDGQTHWSDHLGTLLFWKALTGIVTVCTQTQPLLRQWLASVLLGAVNIEQTKFLNWVDLSLLLGQVVRFPTPQRDAMGQMADEETFHAVMRWNACNVGAQEGGDFYLDPHTKHYTGMRPILKGWCSGIRWADKAMHSDFVHTAQGHPIYFECVDNFADLRERVLGIPKRMRQALGWPADKVLTLIIDRGVFGMEVFDQALKDPSWHLITWEKGYQAGQWQEKEKKGEFIIQRVRNHALDVKTYRFKYMERKWDKNEKIRQLIVMATNPAGVTLEVSVLTDDPTRSPEQALRLIFSRWIQENDFKYLEKHFGINQITSYLSMPYLEIQGQITDRQVKSGQYKALQARNRDLEKQQKNLLFAQEQAECKQERRQRTLAELEKRLVDSASDEAQRRDCIRQRSRLKAAGLKHEKHRTLRREKIQALNLQIQQNQQKMDQAVKEQSRLEQVIDQGMHRMNTDKKRLMDALKISARNLFRQALEPFKKAYDNFRDDHDYFRKLTLSGGVLRWSGNGFVAHLVPAANFQPAMQKLILNLLEQVNAQHPSMPDGSNRPLKFTLSSREDFEIRLK